MVLAAAAAIYFRTNLPISVGLVWVSNPITMPPLFYGAYLLGDIILGGPNAEFSFELSFDWLMNELSAIWAPFLLGCFILGVLSSAGGYASIRLLWRLHIIRQWETKKTLRKLRSN
jgi:uncharacterized protein (DUF2062 family)